MSDEISRRKMLSMGAAGVVATGLNDFAPAFGEKIAEGRVPDAVTKVEMHRGMPTFLVNNRPLSEPVFETYVPEQHYFQQFAEAGTKVYSFSTNLGHGFRKPVWQEQEQFDFSDIDGLAHRVLAADPKALIMPRILLWTPDWWMERNPDEAQVLHNGSRTYSAGVSMGRAGKMYPSVVSAKWRKDMAYGLTRIIQHMQSSDYGANLFGYMVQGLMTEEWYHWSIHTGELSDYSDHAVQAFRKWLQQRYRTSAKLREAWGDATLDFSRVDIPSKEWRTHKPSRTFRNTKEEMSVIDYYLFYNEVIPDTIDYFAAAAKAASGRRKAVGAFYGFMFEFGGDPEFGHNSLSGFLRSPNLDFIMVTASYTNRLLGRGADYLRSPGTSVRLHKKLWYHDNDTVSFLYRETRRKRGQPEAEIRADAENLGVTATAQETIWQWQRSAGMVLGTGCFQSWFDLHGGYFDHPELMAEVKRLNRVFQDALRHDRTSVAEVLVVSDEASCSYAVFESPLLPQTLRDTQLILAKMGVPHDTVLVDDLRLLDMKQYRLVIFLNTYNLNDQQRDLIRRRVLNSGRTCVWCYAPGLFNRHKAEPSAMEELTGIRIVEAQEETRVAPRIALTDSPHPLTIQMRARGLSIIGATGRSSKRFSVEDGAATTLGTLVGTTHTALAIKERRGWNSIYSMTTVLPPSAYRAIAEFAGVHIYNEADDALYASRSYITIAADLAGERVIRFREPSDLFDPVTGVPIASGISALTRHFAAKETVIMRYAPAVSAQKFEETEYE